MDVSDGKSLTGVDEMESLAMSILHDLRSPLAAIYSGAELLKSSPLPDHQVRQLGRSIYNASVRMKDLLDDYIEQYRIREMQPQVSNLGCLVANAVAKIAAVADAQSVAVTQDIPGDLCITVHRARIDSVLANLLGNALDAMPDGGSIHISGIAREDSVVVRVLDAGPGVAPEIRDRLFQPFVTARKSNGWGLGLASARQVVIDHGGDMWLETPSGSGACFGFSLPALTGVAGGCAQQR